MGMSLTYVAFHTHSISILCARKVRRDTKAALIDWVNKYSVGPSQMP